MKFLGFGELFGKKSLSIYKDAFVCLVGSGEQFPTSRCKQFRLHLPFVNKVRSRFRLLGDWSIALKNGHNQSLLYHVLACIKKKKLL